MRGAWIPVRALLLAALVVWLLATTPASARVELPSAAVPGGAAGVTEGPLEIGGPVEQTVEEPGADETIRIGPASPRSSITDHRAVQAMGALLVAFLLAIPAAAWLTRRQMTRRYASFSPQSEIAERLARSDREMAMRFGSRKDDGNDERQEQEEVLPASHSVSEVATQPVLPSRRLQRVAEHFHSQSELLTQMRQQFEEEMEPLHDLLVRQNQAMQRLLQNLEERLRPLNEYADGEEANLDALERRIQEGGTDHVARSFQQYLEDQRRRINDTREQIDAQRVPFVRYGEDQRDAVEVALSRFDDEIQQLEENLAEQRRVMMRMLDAMRSESFTAVKDYLMGRIDSLAELAEVGSTDPGEIGKTVRELRRTLESMAGNSQHVRQVLERADQADQALSSAAVSAGPRALPRDREEPAVEGVEEEPEEESVRSG